jgi:spermidine synthase
MKSAFVKRMELPAVVFFTGACVLVVEVVATRILSPFFGNTIFTVSSILGVVLAALSVGYYFGGRLADRYPSSNLFYGIILASGLSVIFIRVLAVFVLPLFGYKLSITTGPLISSALLFFLPALLLGTLSPFAIKLQTVHFPEKGTGTIAGEIFFWSTLGSISGSLAAGFLLIPQFGIDRIIIGTGLLLAIIALIPLLTAGVWKSSRFLPLLLATLPLLVLGFIPIVNAKNVVHSEDGIYEKITIFDGALNERAARFFQQDRSTSGVMYLDSDELAVDYTKYYALYQLTKQPLKNVLVIGGGAYSIPKAILSELHDVNVDVSEIEPSLLEIGKKYFRLQENPRLKNYLEDGRRLLQRRKSQYDMIFSDVYFSLFSIPSHFTTEEFFTVAKNSLNKNGIFVANLIGGLSRESPSFLFSEINTFNKVFSNSYAFAVESNKKLTSQNIILLGINSDQKIDFESAEIKNSANPILQNLGKKQIDLDRFNLTQHPVLTDNFAPIEYLTSKLLARNFEANDVSPNGAEMMAIISQLLSFGPRFLTASGHEKVQQLLLSEMNLLADQVTTQTWTHTLQNKKEVQLQNIIARFAPEKERRIILASHYDSKKHAHRDQANSNSPVPGANDSASGTAVLMELARAISMNNEKLNVGLDLVFFDGEEGDENIAGNYSNWVPLGSSYFVENIVSIYPTKLPQAAIVLDMVCDKELKFKKEPNSVASAETLVNKFWRIGKEISPATFSDEFSAEIYDDHSLLNKAGIPSLLLIDFEYPAFHTTRDTLDKCSADSLKIVADTVLEYLRRF